MTHHYKKLEEHSLKDRINHFFSPDGGRVLTISDQDTAEDQEAAAALLHQKMLDAKNLQAITIKVTGDKTMRLLDALLVAIFRANVQTLTSIKVTGMKALWKPDDATPIFENSFIRDISIPVEPSHKALFKATCARNQVVRAYHRKINWNAWLNAEGFVFALALGLSTPIVIPPLLSLMGGALISPMLVLLLPVVYLVGIAIALMITQSAVRLIAKWRSQWVKKAYQKIDWETVYRPFESSVERRFESAPISLSVEQIQRCNVLIKAINRFDKAAAIPIFERTGEGFSWANKNLVRLLTALAQLTSAVGVTEKTTFVSSNVFDLALRIANACGYGRDAKLDAVPTLSQHTLNIAKLIQPGELPSVMSLNDLLRALNPLRNRFASQTLQRVVSRNRLTNDITFLNAAAAVEAIKTNSVYVATVAMDSKSLQELVVACNDNVTLTSLTLSFAAPIRTVEAQLIAQIIHRNAAHLRTVEILVDHVEKDAAAIIGNALLSNGAITSFKCSAAISNISHVLSRNRAMRRYNNPRNSILLAALWGGMIPVSIECLALCAGMSLIPASMMTLALITMFAVVPVVGAIMAMTIAGIHQWRLRSKAKAAALLLQQAQLDQLNAKQPLAVVMNKHQYQQAMTVLSKLQKCDPALRPDFPEMKPSLFARSEKKDRERAQHKQSKERVVKNLDGKLLDSKAIKALASNAVFTVEQSTSRYRYFTKANQTIALTGNAVLSDDALKIAVESYDEHVLLKGMAVATA